MKTFNYRLWSLTCSCISFAVFFATLYFQYFRALQPCPLCIMQRICALLLAVIALIIFLKHKSMRTKSLLLSLIVIAMLGVYFATRQLWLQSLTTESMPACLPGLDIMLRYLPLKDILHALIWGSAECSEVTWRLYGLSMAAWSLLYFGFIVFGSIISYFGSPTAESKP